MALDFTYTPPPPLQVPSYPTPGGGRGAGIGGALQGIMAQRMKKKVAAQQQEEAVQAMEEAEKSLSSKDAYELREHSLADASPWGAMTRDEFEDTMRNRFPNASDEEVVSFGSTFFAKLPRKVWDQELIGSVQRTLVPYLGASGANDFIDRKTAGGYAGMKDLFDDLNNDALRNYETFIQSRKPDTNITIGMDKGLGNPATQLAQAGEGVTFEKGGLADIGMPSWVMTRELGMVNPSRSTQEQGLRGWYDKTTDQVRFETTLKGDRGEEQANFAARLTEEVNERAGLKNLFTNYFGTGGLKKDPQMGLRLRDYAQTVIEEPETGKPQFIERGPDGKPKRVDLDDFWKD